MKTGRNPNGTFVFRGDNITEDSGRCRARRLFSLGPCIDCGEPGIDRHHEDGNTKNNDPENVKIVCRTCHMIRDGRMEKFLIKLNPSIGEDNGRAKLTEADVLRIRELYRKGLFAREVASIFKVSISTICKIKYREIWKHI
jgi:hypothetical protein